MFRHGVIIGKFYPPHAGHHYLILEAAAAAENVTVVVMASVTESVSLADRIAWLRAEHEGIPGVAVSGITCDAPFDLTSRTVWAAQTACMKAAVRVVNTEPVDAVFTSEAYGDELAGWFGAKHVSVDPDRGHVPISASACRDDLAGMWSQLSEPVRVGLVTQIVVVGTGAADMSRQLTEHYRGRGGIWAKTDDTASSPVLIRDVDPYQHQPPGSEYLVLDEDDESTTRLVDTLTAAGQSWILLTGTPADRLDLAIRVSDKAIAYRAKFGPRGN